MPFGIGRLVDDSINAAKSAVECLAAAAERTSSELCGLIAALEDHFILRPLSHSRPGLPRVLASLILVSCPSI